MDEDIEELTRRVQEAPDLASRAAILDVDVPALRLASRRFLGITWTAGILVALVVAGLPAVRLFSLVAAHEAFDGRPWIANLLLGAACGFTLLSLAGVPLGILKILLERWLPGHLNVRFVLIDLLAAILLPFSAALAWIWLGGAPLVGTGSIAGAVLVALPNRRAYDFVGALRSNKPRIGAAIARQQRVDHGISLVNGQARWLTLEALGTILGWTGALLLVFKFGWTLVPLMALFFLQRSIRLALELRHRNRTGAHLQFAIGVALAVLALVVAGHVLWPSVTWVAPPVPA